MSIKAINNRMRRDEADRMVWRGEARTREDARIMLGWDDGLGRDVRASRCDGDGLESEGRWVGGRWVPA